MVYKTIVDQYFEDLFAESPATTWLQNIKTELYNGETLVLYLILNWIEEL